MPSEVDLVIERSAATLERARARIDKAGARGTQRKLERLGRFAKMSIIGLLLLLVGTTAWSLIFSPIGILGVVLVAGLALAVLLGAGMASREAEIDAAKIADGKLVQVADRTDRWLSQQRPALPAPAQGIADSISTHLAAMRQQLGRLDANAPQGAELRRLVGEELPELVSSYLNVPEPMRRAERNGRVAEEDLVQGLKLVNEEITSLGQQLAATDMDRLSSQKRYLEIRYKDQDQG